MKNKIELTHVETFEYCMLDKETDEKKFYKDTKKIPGFTGLYFRDDKTFFALYPTNDGPTMYFEGEEYPLTPELTTVLLKDRENRRFIIPEYGIEIDYTACPYIGFDIWSYEIDIDLFYQIEQRHDDKDFYDRYTLK